MSGPQVPPIIAFAQALARWQAAVDSAQKTPVGADKKPKR